MLAKHTSPWSPCSDLPAGILGISRPGRVLGLGHAPVPIGAADFILAILHAVHPVLNVLTVADQLDVVPLAHRLGGVQRLAGLGVHRRMVERVGPARLLRVAVRIGVVENLVLDAGKRGPGLILADAEHDAAVGVRRHLVVEFEHEVVVLAGGDDIAGRFIDPAQGAADDLPTRGDVRLTEVAPAGGGLAVEQQLPAGGFFGIRQPIEVRQDRGRLAGDFGHLRSVHIGCQASPGQQETNGKQQRMLDAHDGLPKGVAGERLIISRRSTAANNGRFPERSNGLWRCDGRLNPTSCQGRARRRRESGLYGSIVRLSKRLAS